MAERQKVEQLKELPEVIFNTAAGKGYRRGKFLGKGGFAKCYELTDMDTNEIFAGKVVSKSLLTKKHQKDKMAQEINIHRSLSHRHIVGFHGYFEDQDNVYILLELCRKRSLMELHKRRRAVTEPEARYFMRQIIDACLYLHGRRVIHRDLKLGNLFLNDDMEMKIGDFGLATTLDYDGERKKTLCGTPNYIAPEMLRKTGHSYEVDIWAIGCVLFTLVVGKPPFETQSLKETYMRIKRNEYHVPSRISASCKLLIERLLQPEPQNRPSIHEVLGFEFFAHGFLPTRLPVSCLTMAPKFPAGLPCSTSGVDIVRKPLLEAGNALQPAGDAKPVAPAWHGMGGRALSSVPEDEPMMGQQQGGKSDPTRSEGDMGPPRDFYLRDLYTQLNKVVDSKPGERANIQLDEAEDPAASPVFWVSKWVDYSDKYGLGYQLCDGSVGVLFNDQSKLILNRDGQQVQFVDKDNSEHYFTIDTRPEMLAKKVTLLSYFRNYMNEHLLMAGGAGGPREGDELARMPLMRFWFRTRSGIVMHLTNGTLQINFFQDHTKVILCPLMQAVTYIDEQKDFRTFKLSLIEQYGCSRDLASRLKYAKTMVERLIAQRTVTGSKVASLVETVSAPSSGSSAVKMN